jgi:phenylacetate-CoA ligase
MAGWGAATRGITKTGPCKLLNVHSTTSEQWRWLKSTRPNYLLSYPSVLVAIAQEALSRDEQLPSLLQVRTFGETLDRAAREICARAFHAPIVDNYSAEEVGNIALQCPQSQRYHTQDESLLVEILDDVGQPAAVGKPGRIVVTTLQNYAMPLIRYELGDYVIPGAPCDCGRGLDVIERILGRTRNMFVRPDGQQVWPALQGMPEECPDLASLIHQFQIVQEAPSRITAKLVTGRKLDSEETRAISNWIERSLGWSCEVALQYVNGIARSPRGKYEDFRSDFVPRA